MTNLSDTQRILLSTASQRESGSIFPLACSLKPGGGLTKAVNVLVERGFAEERETSESGAFRRTDGDRGFGAFVTAAGLAAIGVAPDGGSADDDLGILQAAPAPVAKPSKTAIVLDLLRRPDGATLTELIEATGWLPHTTRAALTGIRKKGHEITRGKRGEVTCWFVATSS